MQVNKNGIAIQTPKKPKRRNKPNFYLPMRKFVLIDEEAYVEVVVPQFSPILDVLIKDGWREIE